MKIFNKQEVESFLLNDNKLDISLPMTPIEKIKEVLEELGYRNDSDGDDTNGWQVDFWYYFTKDRNTLCLSGSLFYGDFSLSKELNYM